MKKFTSLQYSIGVNIVLLVIIIFMGWPEQNIAKPLDLTKMTQQDLEKSLKVERGMSKEKVMNVFGVPAIKEILDTKEEWHYCRTGELVDEYVVVDFTDDVVSSMSNYTVSWLDIVFKHTQSPTEATVAAGGYGDCRLTAKWGTYTK